MTLKKNEFEDIESEITVGISEIEEITIPFLNIDSVKDNGFPTMIRTAESFLEIEEDTVKPISVITAPRNR